MHYFGRFFDRVFNSQRGIWYTSRKTRFCRCAIILKMRTKKSPLFFTDCWIYVHFRTVLRKPTLKYKPSDLDFRDFFSHYRYPACSKPSCCPKTSPLLHTLKLFKLRKRVDSGRYFQEAMRMLDGNQVEISCSFRRDNSVSCSKILIFGTPSAPNIPI